MIVVKIELWPFGREEKKEEIGRTYIGNDGSGSVKRGNYDVWICRRGTSERPPDGKYTRRGRVEDFPRKSYSVWRLIARAILACYPEEK